MKKTTGTPPSKLQPVKKRRVKAVATKISAPTKKTDRRADDVLPNFPDLVDSAVEGVLVHRNFRPLYVNQAMATLFGYDNPAEIKAMPILRRLFPADSWARMEGDYDALIRGRRPSMTARARGLRQDGREIWMAMTARVTDWHGTPAIHMTALDISAQMEVEQNLLHSEQRLRAMLDILPQPIYIARRKDGEILYANRKTCLLLQQSTSQLLHAHSVDFFVDPKERDELAQLFDTLNDIRDVEVRLKTASGRPFIAEMAAIAVDYAGGPAVLVALNDVSQRKQLEAELFQQASTDQLTGIPNRRYFMTQAEQEIRRARRFQRSLSVMMVDIDHFKSINDHQGHAAGDAVLQAMTKRSLESLRQSDVLGRLGGEEFAVLMPETDLQAAREAAERLRKHIESRPMVAERHPISCTISIGVAQLMPDDTTIDVLLHRADAALYRAKKGGRNRIEASTQAE